MITDGNGKYRFEQLSPGSYYVQFNIATLPPDTYWTLKDQGGNDLLDSDVGFSGMISIEYEANPQDPSPDLKACIDIFNTAVKKIS
mgnify:CR=1 FL=1